MNTIPSNKLNWIILLTLLGFMILQTNCKKEEEKKIENEEILGTLNGTVWEYMRYYDTNKTNILYDYVLSFMDSTYTWTVVSHYESEVSSYTFPGTYVYDYPNVKLIDTDGSYSDFIISGNKMSGAEGEGNEYMIFIKQ